MRNPLARLARRDPTKPSLRERAAALKLKAARVLKRRPNDADADRGRRSLMAGSLAAVLPLPALASQGAALPHPDAELLAAGEHLEAARITEKAAIDAYYQARRPLDELLKACPPELGITIAERKHVLGWQWPTRLGCHVRHLPPADGEMRSAWTGEALRQAIKQAVPRLGQGGQTPHRIRRWRSLLPVADAFDARVAALRTLHDCDALSACEQAARKAAEDAWHDLDGMIATTPEGLAVMARRAGRTSWESLGPVWSDLLRSAAAMSGVDLATVHAPWNRPSA